MSNIFFINRLTLVLSLLLMVALVFSSCRWLAPRQSSPQSPFSPNVNNIPPPSSAADEPDRYQAFRPIITEPYMQPSNSVPVPPLPPPEFRNEPPKTEAKPDAVQLKIDELERKNQELKTQLLEKETQITELKQQQQPETEPVPEEEVETPKIKKLPTINLPGVKVSKDELHRVRFEVMDKVLFVPNDWQLTAEGEETLRKISAEIRAYDSDANLDIEGHTDNLIRDPGNKIRQHEVTAVKAKVVMDFFVNTLRWDASRIGSSSFGSGRPVAENGTPEGRERNNRIEVVLRSASK